jgi:ribosomal protein S18 acetylase RimI-like enzyme
VVVGCFEYRREGANAAYIGMVTVSPLKQNSGLGRMLLEEAEARARKEGRTELYMTVIGTRSELIQWYQRRGFCVTTEFREFPANDPRNGDPKVPVEALRMVVLRKIVGSGVGG